MKRFIALLTAVLMMVGLMGTAVLAAPKQEQLKSTVELSLLSQNDLRKISFSVKNQDSEPLAGVSLYMNFGRAEVFTGDISDASGTISSEAYPGTYTYRLSLAGYVNQTGSITVVKDGGNPAVEVVMEKKNSGGDDNNGGGGNGGGGGDNNGGGGNGGSGAITDKGNGGSGTVSEKNKAKDRSNTLSKKPATPTATGGAADANAANKPGEAGAEGADDQPETLADAIAKALQGDGFSLPKSITKQDEAAETVDIGLNIKDQYGRPVSNVTVELHSTPKSGKPDSKGWIRFNDVEVGSHTLYLKNDKNKILATKKFNVALGGKVGVDMKTDTVYAGNSEDGISVTINYDSSKVKNSKGTLAFASVEAGIPSGIPVAQTLNSLAQAVSTGLAANWWKVAALAVGTLALIVIVVIVFIKRRRDDEAGFSEEKDYVLEEDRRYDVG